MAKVFDLFGNRTVVFYGAGIAAAREGLRLSQGAFAEALSQAGLEKLCGRAVCQRTISRIEAQEMGFMTKNEAEIVRQVLKLGD